MSKKKRTIIGIVVAELLLAGIWIYLSSMGASQPDRVTADFQSTLGSTMGMAMGALLGLGVVAFFIAAKNDRG